MFRMALGVDVEEILAQTEWLSSLAIFFLAIHTLGTDQSTTLINLRDTMLSSRCSIQPTRPISRIRSCSASC